MPPQNDGSATTREGVDGKPLNPFARMEFKENQRENSNDGQTTIRRIIAPSQPTVVYNDDSKSAAILSTLLKSTVEKPKNVERVVERKRASVVPLLGLRDRVAQLVGPQKDSSKDGVGGDGTSLETKKEGSVPQMHACEAKVEKQYDDDDDVVVVVDPPEEINLVSSDEDVEACEEQCTMKETIPEIEIRGEHSLPPKRSTGVALFDAFTANVDDDAEEEEGFYLDDEEEEDSAAINDDDDDDDDDYRIDETREIRNVPNVVEIDGTVQPWWKRFPDFVPVSELADGRDPRNGETVFVNYMSQFKGTKVAQVGKATRKDSKQQSQTGHWVSRDGERCFVTPQGESLSGRAAYVAYKSYSKPPASKKTSTRKRRRKRSKKKS
jgi:hypothetical protein